MENKNNRVTDERSSTVFKSSPYVLTECEDCGEILRDGKGNEGKKARAEGKRHAALTGHKVRIETVNVTILNK